MRSLVRMKFRQGALVVDIVGVQFYRCLHAINIDHSAFVDTRQILIDGVVVQENYARRRARCCKFTYYLIVQVERLYLSRNVTDRILKVEMLLFRVLAEACTIYVIALSFLYQVEEL